MDNFTDRLSEYMDNELNATDALELEQHLRECAECAGTLADLRLIAAHAGALDEREPSRDLWSGIAAEIGVPGAAGNDVAKDIIPLDKHRSVRRSITLSMPQLAAAAIVLLAIGGTAVWQMQANMTASVATSPNSSVARNVAARPAAVPTLGYDAAIGQLEQAADQNKTQLNPETTRVIEQSMSTIDRAIADARAALAADPANAYLHRHLDRTMKQKLELLRQASKIDRGGA